MSRLIVKNLPKSITEDSLRQTFGEHGTVTDVQLKFTPEGKFRRFAFIGYQNEDAANSAVKTLNKTFIKTSRISVENCSALGEQKTKPWNKKVDNTVNKAVEENKITKKKTNKKIEETDEATQLLEKYKDDPLFEEFLQVHVPTEVEKLVKLKTKDDEKEVDSGQESAGDEGSKEEQDEEENAKLANEQISDMEYMKQLMKGSGERKPRQKMEKKVKEKKKLFTVKLSNLPYNTKKKDIKQFFNAISCYSIRVPRAIHGIAFVGFKTEKLFNQALKKDRSFIKGKQVTVSKYDKVEDESQDNDYNKNNISKVKWKNQEESLKNEENIAESGRIFFRNLSYTTTEDDIEKLFSKYGPLAEVILPVDKTTRKMKGFGVVTFLMPEHAVKAYSELDGTVLHGRMLHLLPGKSKDVEEENLDESTNYKKKKLAKQKAQAGAVHNWNSLFLGHDAVAEAIAENYGTTKQAVVGPEGQGSAAVRLALGETEIVAQTRKYLEREGVVLDAFSDDKIPRSKTLILIKNLPSRTEVKELREIFEKHGEIARIILPPSGITAIIEFLEPSEAKKAFTRLAYSKFKNVPLYLEWAPETSLTEKPKQEEEKGTKLHTTTSDTGENKEKDETEEEDEDEPEPETTLFVKNLNFKTTDDDLRKHFEGCGKIHYANVATKKDQNDPKNKLSMGYGFVRFKLKKSADQALKTLQQSVLDGKSLELKRSQRTLKEDVKTLKKPTNKTKQTGSKILVRNVPFQANKKEIQELFSTFGEIKALRLPQKMGVGANSHRGFAFVDYTTASDAKAAFKALSQSTHLYGRRLVLEWASSAEGIDEIRKRTASHFKEKDVVKSKKSVFNIDQ